VDCETDHYLLVAKVRDTPAVSRRMVTKMGMEIFNLKQLNEEEVKKKTIRSHSKTSLQIWKT
jgi:hypothetical protein